MQDINSTSDPCRDVDAHIRQIRFSRDPEPRSFAALQQKTGMSYAQSQQSNDDRADFTVHRLELAIAVAYRLGLKITQSVIQNLSGASAGSIQKYKHLWKENLDVTLSKAAAWSATRIRNVRRYLGRYVRGIGETSRDRQRHGRDYSIPRRDVWAAKCSSISRLGRVLRRKHALKTKTVQALNIDSRGPQQPTGAREVLGSIASIGGVISSLALFKPGQNLQPRCPKTNDSLPAEIRSIGAAKNKAESGAAAPIQSFPATNEVSAMYDRSKTWKPKAMTDKPPGSPYFRKKSDSSITPPATRSSESPPITPLVRGQEIYRPERVLFEREQLERWKSCPPDVREQIEELKRKFRKKANGNT